MKVNNNNNNNNGKMKEVVKDSYMSKLKLLLKSKLSCRNLIMAINTLAIEWWDLARSLLVGPR